MCRKSDVVALLRTGKSKNFHPISLLCHTYKLFEQLLLCHLESTVNDSLIREQAGFDLEKSCTGHILNLTQRIEKGCEKKIIGNAFVDLSAVYDTINQKKVLTKGYTA